MPVHHDEVVSGHRTPLEAFIYTLTLCSWPSFFMLLGSFAVFCRQPSVTFVQMTQHLGAGIVLSAVATELLPAMSAQAKTHWGSSSIATLIGFFLGVAMMVSVEKFCGEPEEEEGEGEEEEGGDKMGSPVRILASASHASRRNSLNDSMTFANAMDASASMGSLPNSPLGPMNTTVLRRRSLVDNYRRSSLSEKDGDHRVFDAATPLSSGRGAAARESTSLLPSTLAPPPSTTTPSSNGKAGESGGLRNVPWTLVVAVYVDSFMDGLLIGISAVAGANAGLIMTVALTIEMMFLGLTFSASLKTLPRPLRYSLVTGAPCMILVGGGVGAVAAAILSANPIVQIGLIAFGVAALLYLVTEELLIEAHETGEGHNWLVDSCFFVGFIASVLLEQAVDGGGVDT